MKNLKLIDNKCFTLEHQTKINTENLEKQVIINNQMKTIITYIIIIQFIIIYYKFK